jgi:hypothetical protein
VNGPATVRLLDGRTYAAENVEVEHGAVEVTAGRLQVSDLIGVRTYEARSFTVPISAIREITWAAQSACRPALRAAA